MIHWNEIDSVLLDMDGTLLDLHYDNHFWREHVPRRYADKNGLSLAEAKTDILERYRRVEGTLDWYCVDFWSRELGLNIPMLKEEVDHLIAVHPHVLKFLAWLRRQRKRIVLVTNAHGKTLALKFRRTRIGEHFDAVVCAHDLRLPKEHPDFWRRLHDVEPYENNSTLLIDDSLPVLRSAQRAGLAHLLTITRPDSKGPIKTTEEFPAIQSFLEIMP